MSDADLEKRLRELELEFLHGVPVHLTDEMIAQILTAIKDAGYKSDQELKGMLFGWKKAHGYMTGAEWYARLEAEINKIGITFQAGDTGSRVVEAAKRAAGLADN